MVADCLLCQRGNFVGCRRPEAFKHTRETAKENSQRAVRFFQFDSNLSILCENYNQSVLDGPIPVNLSRCARPEIDYLAALPSVDLAKDNSDSNRGADHDQCRGCDRLDPSLGYHFNVRAVLCREVHRRCHVALVYDHDLLDQIVSAAHSIRLPCSDRISLANSLQQ